MPGGIARLSRLNELGGFDKLVSVGMFEHVGENKLPLYFQHAYELFRRAEFS